MTTPREEATPIAAPPSAPSTNFDFLHKVFTLPGAVFKKDRITQRVALHMSLGDMEASVEIQNLSDAFGIPPNSTDAQMLRSVERGLRFVKEIRPGDSIPYEILNGTASWQVEPRHLDLARSRLLIQLTEWVTEGEAKAEEKPTSKTDILAMIERPEVIVKINAAFLEAAQRLNLGKDGKKKITEMIEQLARELSYIEALREKIAGYLMIRRKLSGLRQIYRNDNALLEPIDRTMALTRNPISEIREIFLTADSQTKDIIHSLQTLGNTIHSVRESRDRLRETVLLWGDLDSDWADVTIERKTSTEQLVVKTYRFVAAHYTMAQRWALQKNA